ncbi:hypothetical protein KGY79_10070, partial [Candidatus Bipolaricaulota bacterium]|nr:hypothetical protein [Candidatus Bipolaricaulota bacterium]
MLLKTHGLKLLPIALIASLLIAGSVLLVLADGKDGLNCNQNFTKVYERQKERVVLLGIVAEKKNIEAKEKFVDLVGYLEKAVKSGGPGVMGVINQGKLTIDFLWDFNDFLWETMEFWGEAIAIIDPYSELYQNYEDLNIATPNSPLNGPTLIT